MFVVLDANILFKALIGRGNILKLFFLDEINLLAPEFLFEEFEKFVEILKSRIKFVSLKYFSDKIPEAKELSKQLKDITYFALALKLDCSIWSGEKSFNEQSKVKVFNTRDLLGELSKLSK